VVERRNVARDAFEVVLYRVVPDFVQAGNMNDMPALILVEPYDVRTFFG
jgi:hypothetical protein